MIITFGSVLSNSSRLKCYFHAERFIGRDGELRHGELALNPDAFIGRSDADILSILVHEMVHGC